MSFSTVVSVGFGMCKGKMAQGLRCFPGIVLPMGVQSSAALPQPMFFLFDSKAIELFEAKKASRDLTRAKIDEPKRFLYNLRPDKEQRNSRPFLMDRV